MYRELGRIDALVEDIRRASLIPAYLKAKIACHGTALAWQPWLNASAAVGLSTPNAWRA